MKRCNVSQLMLPVKYADRTRQIPQAVDRDPLNIVYITSCLGNCSRVLWNSCNLKALHSLCHCATGRYACTLNACASKQMLASKEFLPRQWCSGTQSADHCPVRSHQLLHMAWEPVMSSRKPGHPAQLKYDIEKHPKDAVSSQVTASDSRSAGTPADFASFLSVSPVSSMLSRMAHSTKVSPEMPRCNHYGLQARQAQRS